MNLTTNSNELITFFLNNKHINYVKFTKNTKQILRVLYDDITHAYNYLYHLNKTPKYSIQINEIDNITKIPKPKTFNINSFPVEIINYINDKSLTELNYNFYLYERNITIKFIVEQTILDVNLDIYNNYVDSIIMWFYILNNYAPNNCSKNVIIYIYLTSLGKTLPNNNHDILNNNNVNTAFTRTCSYNSEIVIFRKEEWFKVLLHETFHNFGLDFSDMNTVDCNKQLLSIFKVSSEVNLYEAYAEFWAEIINSLFCSFFITKNKEQYNEFLLNAEMFINFERTFSFFQVVKTLNYMGLRYIDLYSNSKESELLRNTFYREKTSILSYYIIKLILINKFQDFFEWCDTYNDNLLKFKKTMQNQFKFCDFIKHNYKHTSLIKGITSTELFFNKIKLNKRNKNNYLLTNMRMSICELG